MAQIMEFNRPIDVAETFADKRFLIIGTTGFVGKVLLSMLLSKYPGIGRVTVLVRAGRGGDAKKRFMNSVASSPAMDPLRDIYGDSYEEFLEDKVRVVDGDITSDMCGFDDDVFHQFDEDGGIDLVVNSAGLVSFTPELESGLTINAEGAKNVMSLAKRLDARLVHVSTCYVAGLRNGEVWEDEDVLGYFPRKQELHDRDFDAEAEIEDCWRTIRQVKGRADDRSHVSQFREQGAEYLRKQRRDPEDPIAMADAVSRMRKKWLTRRLTDIGQERATHWGWPNTYTYTKSLGEQVLFKNNEVPFTIVRPAVVESSYEFPFPGWNEGFNTTAPLVYLILKGQRQIVAGDSPLDVVPVDMVCAGMVLAMAALLEGRHKQVYHLGTSHQNPASARRMTELTGLAVRRYHLRNAKKKAPLVNKTRARLEVMVVDYDQFQAKSAPRFNRWAKKASKYIDEKLPRWGAPRVQAWAERAQDELGKVEKFTSQVTSLVELFKAFTADCDIRFRSDNTEAAHKMVTEHDQHLLPWKPGAIHWRDYWLDTHFPGLRKWVFPILDNEFGSKKRIQYSHRDLLELFDAAAALNRERPAVRRWRKGKATPTTYSYSRMQAAAEATAVTLKSWGVSSGDRIALISESRPEWSIAYFGILKAGAIAVPIDPQLTPDEIKVLMKAGGCRIVLVSTGVAMKMAKEIGGDPMVWLQTELPGTRLARFQDVMTGDPAKYERPEISGDSPASIIFTSGTTGRPKGVVLSHKNLTSMAAQMSALFKLYRHDSLLSVLPLHHTFEFSAGLLMPLLHGSTINYMRDFDQDALKQVLKKGNITAMIGVPAVYQLFHRKIVGKFREKGPFVARAFEAATELHRQLLKRIPYRINLGRWLFFPIHQQFGGRMRLMISGGSALSPKIMKSLQGMGFSVFEGYGMTEASPVIAAQRPGGRNLPGSVGQAVPGVEIKIVDPDEKGVGEVIARGPNIMQGYYENEEATAQTLKDGWLYTGDLGWIDSKSQLHLSGRKKDMILGAAGENVYPDELEDLYGKSKYVKEISVVGLPDGGTEIVAALIVPDYDKGERLDVQAEVRAHMSSVGKQLAPAKRIKTYYFWDHELPKTSTRKIKRADVVEELKRLHRVSEEAYGTNTAADSVGVVEAIATVCHKSASEITPGTLLDSLGFDSLMTSELLVALETRGCQFADPHLLAQCETVKDVIDLAREASSGEEDSELPATQEDSDFGIPAPLVQAGRRALRYGQHWIYHKHLNTKVEGRAYLPGQGGYIVAANHASHLDMGLVKYALGDQGDLLVALAAKDYFFDDPVRRVFFENFTNLVPMERYGSLRESLRLANEMLKEGRILLIFPEGTRSRNGKMIDFKPSLGYLAQTNNVGILPMTLVGTYNAMPAGSALPKAGKRVTAKIAPFVDVDQINELGKAGKSRGYRDIAEAIEVTVRSQVPRKYEWTLGESGRHALEAYNRAQQEAAEMPAEDSTTSKKENVQ